MPFDSWYIAHLKDGLFCIHCKTKLYFTHGRLNRVLKVNSISKIKWDLLTSPFCMHIQTVTRRTVCAFCHSGFGSHRVMCPNPSTQQTPHQAFPEHQLLTEHMNSEGIFTHNSLASKKWHAYIFLDRDKTGSSRAQLHWQRHSDWAYINNTPALPML